MYASNRQVNTLRSAYATQLSNEGYQKFLQTGVIVEGVYDDHDYGNNDAGKELPSKLESLHEYLRFLNTSARIEPMRQQRDGAYSCHIYGTAPNQVKVIFLDTRYNRDYHWIPSLGAWYDPFFEFKVPFGALIAAVVRMATVYFPFTSTWSSKYDGEVLGKEQFRWK